MYKSISIIGNFKILILLYFNYVQNFKYSYLLQKLILKRKL